MEIRPGQGVEGVALGDSRADVRSRLGPPRSAAGESDFFDEVVVRYDDSDLVELVEVPYSDAPSHSATFQGVRLTFRPIDEVVSDLVSLGLTAHPKDIGFDFESGLSIWSMGSLTVRDTDPSASENDDRLVVEGVSVGSPAYYGFKP